MTTDLSKLERRALLYVYAGLFEDREPFVEVFIRPKKSPHRALDAKGYIRMWQIDNIWRVGITPYGIIKVLELKEATPPDHQPRASSVGGIDRNIKI